MKKTTKKDFEIFKKECKKWIDYFGLNIYRVEFFISKEANGNRGMTKDYNQLMAVDIIFPEELHDETGIEKIKSVAFHEVCEVMFMRIRKMAGKYFDWNLVDREIHTIIRMLENSIYTKR